MMACAPELQSQDDWLTCFLRPLLPLKLDGSHVDHWRYEPEMTLEEE
jgi:hypothetical protein